MVIEATPRCRLTHFAPPPPLHRALACSSSVAHTNNTRPTGDPSHTNVLAWLISVDWPKGAYTIGSVIEGVASSGNVEAMILLQQNGFALDGHRNYNNQLQFPSAAAAEMGHLPMLQYIYENGGTLTAEASSNMHRVTASSPQYDGKLACMEFLLQNRCPLFDG